MPKQINRNPFNEKIIHRYVLELLYGITGADDLAARARLLHSSWPRTGINLVVPEASVESDEYRPDFHIYFKSDDKPRPIEIKWLSKDLKDHQLKHIRDSGGVLIALDRRDDLSPAESKAIDAAHFEEWLARRARSLWRDSLASFIGVRGEARWVVVLHGAAAEGNFDRMKALARKGGEQAFWAFKNNAVAVKAQLGASAGDIVIFLFVTTAGVKTASGTVEGNRLVVDGDNLGITINRAVLCEIRTPHFMAINGPISTFFEQGRPSINNRKWPHFINFKILKDSGEENGSWPWGGALFLEERGSLARPMAESLNHGGVLQPITTTDYDQIIGFFDQHSRHA
jgi:hypothetical protein